ncbi:DUF2244 domain-containing protein [Nitrospirillum sp. BR 11828]|uniref:DUF2244 domain-containing protein n=1 Tax=Nitrospirillum sp. BR 11828 TaxID=3104325 RepID=UPI002ACA131C|nr:DUF2244 domain-containing protein [Nitrospirillum sp. BR 11828]MDZ5646729.1 DUF2244 domain-containing protein [Nitrospirillum sp. BR 11828]
MIHDETTLRQTWLSVILRPHRSLSPMGFRILMGVVAAVSFGVGLVFYLRGAWPVIGFCGVDVLVIYLAFRASYRSARLYERVELTDQALTVERVEPRRPSRRWSFVPYWLRVHMDDPARHDSQVVLTSHGKRLVVGSFLPMEERVRVASTLSDALARHKNGGF